MIQVPVYGTQHPVEAGRLVDVMQDHVAAPMPVSLLYPNRRQMAPRVQALLNWMTQVVQPYLEATQPARKALKKRREPAVAGALTSKKRDAPPTRR